MESVQLAKSLPNTTRAQGNVFLLEDNAAAYTIWHAFMAKGVTDPFPGTIDLPLGDRDGTQSVFTTDAKGNGILSIKFDQCLQLGEVQLASMIGIAYHADGKTYGTLPGDFGTVTQVQLFAILPDASDVLK